MNNELRRIGDPVYNEDLVNKGYSDKNYLKKPLENGKNTQCYMGDYSWGTVVESTTNNVGTYIKYNDGTMIQYFNFSITATINSAWGNWYEKDVIFPSFPTPFINSNIMVSLQPISTALWIEYCNPNSSGLGAGFIARPVSTESKTYYINCIAIGKWR